LHITWGNGQNVQAVVSNVADHPAFGEGSLRDVLGEFLGPFFLHEGNIAMLNSQSWEAI